MSIRKTHFRSIITSALQEDHVDQDITTNILFPTPIRVKAIITAKEDLVIAGLEVAKHVFYQVDPILKFSQLQKDGDSVKSGTTCCTITGNVASLLKAERIALNFLQHLSGIATLTNRFCKALQGSRTKILDTRKTTPGLRYLQKWAVSLGGGTNHRQSLKDGILIKDNHLAVLTWQGITLAQACLLAKKHAPRRFKVCVETDSLPQVQAALQGKADVILLDNMSPHMARKAVKLINGRALVEISGGITLKNIGNMAKAGADFISIGALTHSAPAMDFSMVISSLISQKPLKRLS